MHPHRRAIAISSIGLLALTALMVAFTPAGTSATTRSLAITQSSANPQVPFQAFDGNPVKVFDINGDGQKEIIAQNDNQWVYVFDSKTGAILSELKTNFPQGWGARSFNGPEVAIMTQGDAPRLVVANSAAVVTQYKYDSVGSSGTQFKWTKEWERRLNDCYKDAGMDAKPVLADLDKDGRMEILVATEELGTFALRDNGDIVWKNCMGGGNAEPTVGDLNQDGWPDVVHVSDAGIVSALNGRSGAWMWSFNLLKHFNLGSGSIPVGAGIGQLDGLGGPDVVVGARDSHDGANFSNDHAILVALDHAGRLLWSYQDPTGNPLTYTHPIVADADADGTNEVYWGDWNTVGHKPPWPGDPTPAWKPTGPANYYRVDHQGQRVWKQTLNTFWSNKDLALADVDGDGVQEVLANGPNANGHDGIWYLDSRTGAKETHVLTYPWKAQRGPVVADLWDTGTTQWVLEVAGQADNAGHGILVYDTGAPYNAAWPHLPYPTVGPPNPPPAGTFGATFTIKSPGEWWQEVYVRPTTARTLSSVDIRLNNGFWQPMSKSSWGAWTSSIRAPAGTQVEFLATDTNRYVSQSLPFTWLDGTLSRNSTQTDGPTTSTTSTSSAPTTTTVTTTTTTVATTTTTVAPTTTAPITTSLATTTTTPPPTTTAITSTTTPTSTATATAGPFDATFRPTSGVNEWWVEVVVNANEPLVGVDAQVNGGTWVALEKKSWGTWAKSFHAPSGSKLVFRATSASGATDVSETFYWLTWTDPGFQVTFTPVAVGNDWWVEVKASSAQTITKVEANVNNGAWTALTLQSWGHWAKSFYVPNGSEIRFRATNGAGQTVVSEPTVWP